jgi:flagellar biosynthetic protein FliO
MSIHTGKQPAPRTRPDLVSVVLVVAVWAPALSAQRVQADDGAMTPSSSPPVIDTAEGTSNRRSAAADSAPVERVIQRPTSPGARGTPQAAWWRHPLVSLGAVLAVIVVLSMLARRYIPAVRAASSGVLKVIARTHLSPRQSVVLIQVGRRMVVAGVTPEHIEPLCVLDDPEENARLLSTLAPGDNRSEAFSQVLTAQRENFDDAPEVAGEGGAAGDPALPAVESLQRSRRQLKHLLDALRTRKAG